MDERLSGGNDWLRTQQEYWDAWLDLGRQALSGAAGEQASAGSGADALVKWWEVVSTAAPPDARDMFTRLIGLSRPYFKMAETFLAQKDQGARGTIDQWLEGMQHAFAGPASADDAARRGTTTALWGLPLDNWQRSMTSLLPIPGDVPRTTKADDLTRAREGLRDRADRLLAVPAVGYNRETQQQYQELARLNLRYLEALQEYNAAFQRVSAAALERFRANIDSTERETFTLRALYDAWVDVCEEAYAEHALSDDHARCYGRLVNTLAAVKRHSSICIDELFESMGLPTRREIDTMQRQMHRARRESRELRAEIDGIKERLEYAMAQPRRARTVRKTKHH